jgi:tetratricopeptide (TPR) repeat protein
MGDDKVLREAIKAIANGERDRARDLLTRLLRTNREDPDYWLWMSAVVDTPKERIFCLKNVLRIDPENTAAQNGLHMLGVISAKETVTPSRFIRQNWVIDSPRDPTSGGIKAYFSNPINRRAFYFLGGFFFVLASLIVIGGIIFRSNGRLAAVKLTITPITWTPKPTATLLPTNTPWLRSPTPTISGPTPLSYFLEATYTPTPLYVNTPHPISEAYHAGIRTFEQGNYEEMLQFMQQAIAVEPKSADVYYYIGEAYRLMGNSKSAFDAYSQAISIDPGFAPAYLGKARTETSFSPTTQVELDIVMAIDKDPKYAEAYLDYAEYHLHQDNPDAALQDLAAVQGLLPGSPLLYLYRSQAYLLLNEGSLALQSAQRSYELDQTLLPVYRTLGEVYLFLDEPDRASEYLHTYTFFKVDDASGWYLLGKAYYKLDTFDQALEALNKSVELDEKSFNALLFRGYTFLALDDGAAASTDLGKASELRPDSFAANIAFSRAMLLEDRPGDAYRQINTSQNLAQNDEQLAEVYYWRAQSLEALGNYGSALDDWEALLKISDDDVPGSWTSLALKRVQTLTPQPTHTQTYTPSATMIPSPNQTVTSSTAGPSSPNKITITP